MKKIKVFQALSSVASLGLLAGSIVMINTGCSTTTPNQAKYIRLHVSGSLKMGDSNQEMTITIESVGGADLSKVTVTSDVPGIVNISRIGQTETWEVTAIKEGSTRVTAQSTEENVGSDYSTIVVAAPDYVPKYIPDNAFIISGSQLTGFRMELITNDMNTMQFPTSIASFAANLPIISHITHVVVNNNITSFGNNYFKNFLPQLQSLDISGITSAISGQDNTFNNCPYLNSIKLGNVTNFNGYAFMGCPINDITIATGTTTITKIDNVENGKIIGQIVVPAGGLTTSTYVSPFTGALAWGAIRLSQDGVLSDKSATSLCANAFQASQVTSVDFSGTGITNLGTPYTITMFRYCKNLESLDLSPLTSLPMVSIFGEPERQMTSKGAYTLPYAYNLQSITLGNVANLNGYSFVGCPLNNITLAPGTTTITKIDNIENGKIVGQIVVPAGGFVANSDTRPIAWGEIKLGQTGVLADPSMAALTKNTFAGSAISSIDFSGTSITSISYGVFNYCPFLEEVHSLGNVSNFNGYAFALCPIKDITLASGVTTITKIDNIENGQLVGQIVVPAGGLTNTTYNVPLEGTLAWGKINLSQSGILANSSATSLGSNVFSGSATTSLDFSGTLINNLGTNSIMYSLYLEKLNLSSITSLPNTFNNFVATKLTSVTLGNVSNFNGYAFMGCPINDIVLAPGVTTITRIDHVENGKLVGQIVVPAGGLTSTTYDSGYTGTLAWGNINLNQNGIIASGTTSLGSRVFCGSNISDLDFTGSGITALGSEACCYSSNLEYVKLQGIGSFGAGNGSVVFTYCSKLSGINFGTQAQFSLPGLPFNGISSTGMISGDNATSWLTYLKSTYPSVFQYWTT